MAWSVIEHDKRLLSGEYAMHSWRVWGWLFSRTMVSLWCPMHQRTHLSWGYWFSTQYIQLQRCDTIVQPLVASSCNIISIHLSHVKCILMISNAATAAAARALNHVIHATAKLSRFEFKSATCKGIKRLSGSTSAQERAEFLVTTIMSPLHCNLLGNHERWLDD